MKPQELIIEVRKIVSALEVLQNRVTEMDDDNSNMKELEDDVSDWCHNTLDSLEDAVTRLEDIGPL